MAVTIPVNKYRGSINTVYLGQSRLPVGGQRSLYLHDFEGLNPNPPRFSLDVWDFDPGDDLPPALRAACAQATADPASWAAKYLEFRADLVSLH